MLPRFIKYAKRAEPSVDEIGGGIGNAPEDDGKTEFAANRNDGVKENVSALRSGEVLYLLPDMDFGPDGSVFVPFFGVPAATVPSIARFARLGRAKVISVVPRMTPQGYDVQVLPAWENFPTGDLEADTLRGNQLLETLVLQMPAQYFWVHKRFKSRPPGQASVY